MCLLHTNHKLIVCLSSAPSLSIPEGNTNIPQSQRNSNPKYLWFPVFREGYSLNLYVFIKYVLMYVCVNVQICVCVCVHLCLGTPEFSHGSKKSGARRSSKTQDGSHGPSSRSSWSLPSIPSPSPQHVLPLLSVPLVSVPTLPASSFPQLSTLLQTPTVGSLLPLPQPSVPTDHVTMSPR